MAVSGRRQRNEGDIQAGNGQAGDACRLIEVNARGRAAIWCLRHFFAGDHRHDGPAGNGDVVVEQDCLDQEPGTGDGNDRDEPDRPDARQAMQVAPEDARTVPCAYRLEEAFPELFVHFPL